MRTKKIQHIVLEVECPASWKDPAKWNWGTKDKVRKKVVASTKPKLIRVKDG